MKSSADLFLDLYKKAKVFCRYQEKPFNMRFGEWLLKKLNGVFHFWPEINGKLIFPPYPDDFYPSGLREIALIAQLKGKKPKLKRYMKI
jgi:hypothetical protein